MIKHEELVKTSEYWFETIQNEIFRQVNEYLKEKKITQTQFAEQLGVTKGYVSQLMKGEFNYSLKKLIELSLAVGKAPVIEFISIPEIAKPNEKEKVSTPDAMLNKVAEPIEHYKLNT